MRRNWSGREDLLVPSLPRETSDLLVPLALSLPKGTRFQALLKSIDSCCLEVFGDESLGLVLVETC